MRRKVVMSRTGLAIRCAPYGELQSISMSLKGLAEMCGVSFYLRPDDLPAVMGLWSVTGCQQAIRDSRLFNIPGRSNGEWLASRRISFRWRE